MDVCVRSNSHLRGLPTTSFPKSWPWAGRHSAALWLQIQACAACCVSAARWGTPGEPQVHLARPALWAPQLLLSYNQRQGLTPCEGTWQDDLKGSPLLLPPVFLLGCY